MKKTEVAIQDIPVGAAVFFIMQRRKAKFPSAASASIDDATGIASFSFLAHENLSYVISTVIYETMY